MGLSAQVVETDQHKLVIISEDISSLPTHFFSQLDGVDRVIRVQTPCPLALGHEGPAIRLDNGATIGGGGPIIIAGPCSVEGRAQLIDIAHRVKGAGAGGLRGGAFKPRTSPYDFRGLGREALEYLLEARQATGLPVVTEVMSAEQVELALPLVDMLQIGARNMYNYELLREVGRSRHPVLLKRAMSATINEFVQAAEYILLEGNLKVVLCERGIRTFETCTRNTLDLSAVAVLKNMTQLPVIVDPSHATGKRELVRPLSRAAVACGADGLMIEVHCDPPRAMSDSSQAITPAVLADIVDDARAIHRLLNPDKALSCGSAPLSTAVAASTLSG